MIFPLGHFIGDIEHVHNIIPQSRYITKNEILSLSYEHILALQIYCYYTMPNYIGQNNYEGLSNIIIICQQIINTIDDTTIIFASGDLAFKFTILLHMMEINKNIKIIMFPVSKLTHQFAYTSQQLDIILKQIIYTNNIKSLDNIIYLGDITSTSYNAIKSSLMRIAGFNTELKYIDICKLWRDNLFDSFIFIEFIIGSDKFKTQYAINLFLVDEIGTLNLTRCNIIIAMLYLLYLGKINKNPYLPSTNPDNIIQNKYMEITYCNIQTSKIVTIMGKINIGDDLSIITTNEDINIPIGTLISINSLRS